MRCGRVLTLLAAMLAMGGAGTARGADEAAAVRVRLGGIALEAEKARQAVVTGAEGYYFLTAEVRHYAAGRFWGQEAGKAGERTNQDPLPPILDFARQCRQARVKLVIVPVPGKVAVYPDKLDAKLGAEAAVDGADEEFYALLRKEGVEVIDLLPAMKKLRAAGQAADCRQDSHYAPAAVAAAAKAIAEVVKKEPWYAGAAKQEVTRTKQTVEGRGDLVQMLGAEVPGEKLEIEQVALGGKAVEGDPKSPVVLMGDSHTIVYHEPINGGIAASGAGLLDHLAAELGFAPDMTGQLGGGANASRIVLARRKDNLAGKKCVVWVFGAREFTQAGQGWMRVPVVR